MRNRIAFVTVAVLATLTACGDSPSGLPDAPELTPELVITQGAPAPAWTPKVRPLLAAAAVEPLVTGSSATPLSLLPQSCTDTPVQVVLTWNITGQQRGIGSSFQVNTNWEFDGTTWTGTSLTTISVPPRSASDDPTIRTATLTVENASAESAGSSSFAVVALNVVNSLTPNLVVTNAGVTIFVAFEPCEVTNTPPTLVVPADFSVEATSAAGADVDFAAMVTATDLEDGDLTLSVICTPASGSTFALGETTVECSVTDNGGLSAEASFKIMVVDTTPAYFTSFPTGTITLVAANISGAILDVSSLGIAVEDVGNVSEPSTYACDYMTGTYIAIGSTITVDCTASDAIGNESEISSFDVFVTLNVNATGFLPPLRMEAPYSAHKRGSTIPHKFVPPTYADGTPALDLAADLRLVMEQSSSDADAEVIEANDYGTGSSEWFLDDDGHYHFNVKTGKTSPWNVGQWQTTVSYMGIVLATTELSLVR